MSHFGFGFGIGKAKKAGVISYDADASAFFTAASITDTTQKSAVNQLVLDLKSYVIWTKCKAIYPVVGGNASSHAVNLKTPGTFNLTFSTGWTHSSTGMTPNNSTAYADTSFNVSSVFSSINNCGFSFYSRTSLSFSNTPNHGIIPTTTNNRMYFAPQSTFYQIQGTENALYWVTFSNTDRKGFYTSVRTSNTSRKTYKNGNVAGSSTGNDTGGTLPSANFFIGATNNNGTASNFTIDQLAFSSLHDGLTDTEAANFYTAVQAFQTTLSRNV